MFPTCMFPLLQRFYCSLLTWTPPFSGVKHLETLKGEKPVVDQIETHCFMQQRDITEYCAKNGSYMGLLCRIWQSAHNVPFFTIIGIVVQAYSPLVRMEKADDPTLVKVAKEVGKETTQVLIRWSLQKG